jgi:hypothetical protein
MSPDPNDPKTEPKSALLVMCVQCGQGIEAPLPIERAALSHLLAQHGWFTSVLSPPGQGSDVPILFGALCTTCAPTVFPPEVLRAAEERRQKLLQGAR